MGVWLKCTLRHRIGETIYVYAAPDPSIVPGNGRRLPESSPLHNTPVACNKQEMAISSRIKRASGIGRLAVVFSLPIAAAVGRT